jgi:hypothetical protein
MKAYLLALLLIMTPAYAIDEYAGEENVDEITEICDIAFIETICDGVGLIIDTTNDIIGDDLETGIDESNSVRDVELVLLEEDRSASADRVANQWNNILSVMVLLLEAVKILFYAAQLFILVHLPYFYVKMLVWTKNMAVRLSGRRG